MRKNTVFYGLTALFFVTLIFNPSYNFAFLNRGIYFTHGGKTIEEIKNEVDKVNVLFAEEGLYGSVLVDSRNTIITVEGTEYDLGSSKDAFFGDLRTLKINGKTQCGTGRLDMVTTGLLGGLPIILGKQGDVLNIGLGCGLTLGVLEKGGFKSIDSLEVDQVVIESSKKFNDIHGNALDDPRSNIVVDDARNYLLKTSKKYDVIVNEPSPPYGISNSNLITKEFFLLTKEHLKEDGIVVQWAPMGQLMSCDEPGFAIFYKTFSSVFPYNHVFISKTKLPITQPSFTKENGEIKRGYTEIYDYPNPRWKHGEAIIIGSLKPIDIEKYFDSFDKSEEQIKRYFEKIRVFDLRDNYMFSSENVVGFSDDVGLNTDDRPIIEFLVAKNLYLKKEQQCGAQRGIKLKKNK